MYVIQFQLLWNQYLNHESNNLKMNEMCILSSNDMIISMYSSLNECYSDMKYSLDLLIMKFIYIDSWFYYISFYIDLWFILISMYIDNCWYYDRNLNSSLNSNMNDIYDVRTSNDQWNHLIMNWLNMNLNSSMNSNLNSSKNVSNYLIESV